MIHVTYRSTMVVAHGFSSRSPGKNPECYLHVYYSSLRGWGDGNLHGSYSSLGDGEMAASIFLILLQGMGRWPPPFLVEEQEVDLRRKSKSNGHIHSYHSSLRGWRDGHIHSSYSSFMGGEMATSILTILP